MKGVLGRLRRGLAETRSGLGSALDRVRGPSLDDDAAEALEEALLAADVSLETAERLVARVRARRPGGGEGWAREALKEAIREIFDRTVPVRAERREPAPGEPNVILVVGVNGTGKTTTIGKLAAQEVAAGRSVLVVAADTFRAAANEQLARWAERAGAEIVRSRPGQDPSSVAFDGVRAAKARGCDVAIVDTAGRLHAKVGLMDEVEKIHRVTGKALDGAPHETLLVLDATTGQNAVRQAETFASRFPLTGLVLTKLDGTARGGVVVSLADAGGAPVLYLGVGESVEDLVPFDAGAFASALVADG